MKLMIMADEWLKQPCYQKFNDYTFKRVSDTTWQVALSYAPFAPFALHEGTAAETMRLFKLLLITRRLTA